MASHFYSAPPGAAYRMDFGSSLTVATSTTAANNMEFRVDDGTVTREQIVQYLERLADYFTSTTPLPAATTG